jgi:hypothetical protein
MTKEPIKLRLDAAVLAALRASGDGWQTRVMKCFGPLCAYQERTWTLPVCQAFDS